MQQQPPPSRFNAGSPGAPKRKKALLIGINYYNQRGELKGCVNDVENIFKLLVITYGWNPHDITILTDGALKGIPNCLEPQSPTRANILSRLRWLVDGCLPGDSLFLLYSGHGAQQEDANGFEEDGMNETILPGKLLVD
jgi:uncharacterized caspase-like protein